MDFRTFVDLLDSEDEVLWVRSEVDPEYELGALLKQAEARDKAICFERVKGSKFAAIGGVMLNPQRHAQAIARSPAQLSQPGAWSSLLADHMSTGQAKSIPGRFTGCTSGDRCI